MANDEWRTAPSTLDRAHHARGVDADGRFVRRSLRNPFSSMGPPAPDILVPASSLDQIIAAVNGNAQKIQSYQTNNATINIPGSLGIPTLRGNIAAMRPGRVRLEATTALTGSEVDLGSNDELFWFWVRRNEPPAVYYARHSQTAGSAAQQLMPIDPQWLLDALGMAEFKPTDRHEGPLPTDRNRVEIKSYRANGDWPDDEAHGRRLPKGVDSRTAFVRQPGNAPGKRHRQVASVLSGNRRVAAAGDRNPRAAGGAGDVDRRGNRGTQPPGRQSATVVVASEAGFAGSRLRSATAG